MFKKNRYDRHLSLAKVGKAGVEKIRHSRVLVVGGGGLGSPALLYLAASGVGHLGISDDDVVDITNLQRQIIHYEGDVGKAKTLSAKEKIQAINSEVEVHLHPRITEENIKEIVKDYDFILEASDDINTKFLVNDTCKELGIAFNIAGILRFQGQMMTVLPGTPCYRSLFPSVPEKALVETCAQAGVLGVLPGVMGTLQATEALKYILGIGELMTHRVLTYDALTLRFHTVSLNN